MKNYAWQDKFLNEPNDKALLCCEAGTGKSHVGGLWLEQKDRIDHPVVFCPKGIISKWGKRAKTKHVYTPQTILKKDVLPIKPTAILVDEAHMWATTLFKAKTRSKCGERLYEYIKNNPDVDILLLTATPVRANPWNLHTLLALKGHYVPCKQMGQKS